MKRLVLATVAAAGICSRDMVAAIKAAGGKKILYREYKGLARVQGTGTQRVDADVLRRQGLRMALLTAAPPDPMTRQQIAPGTYVLASYTRCGHGEGYRVVRVSRKIRAV